VMAEKYFDLEVDDARDIFDRAEIEGKKDRV